MRIVDYLLKNKFKSFIQLPQNNTNKTNTIGMLIVQKKQKERLRENSHITSKIKYKIQHQ